MRSFAPSAAVAAILLVTGLAPEVHAADGDDICKRAREQLGAGQIERGMKPEQCQQALDGAEEERWQLWLDIATADELAGDFERAALSLHRFLEAADARERPLPAHWVVVRDKARADVARMDGDVLRKKARVTIKSLPDDAEVTFVGGAVDLPEKTPRTPVTAYFTPGEHTARLVGAKDATREVTFSVVAGQTIELVVDLRPGGAVRGPGVIEKPGVAVLGKDPVAALAPPSAPGEPPSPGPEPVDGPGDPAGPDEPGEPGGGPDDPVDYIEIDAPDPDPEGPPIRRGGASLVETLGTVSLTAGIGTLAVGLTYALIASGLDDEAACSGTACSVDARLRAAVRKDADVAWDRATGTFIVGGALVVGGVVMLLLDDDGPERDDGDASIVPWLGPDGVGVGAHATF